jgi:hypothetical protein
MPDDARIQETLRRLGGWAWMQDKSYDDLHWLEKRFIEHFEQITESDEYRKLDWKGEQFQLTEGN